MLSRARDAIDDLAGRLGLGTLPTPVAVAVLAMTLAAVVWAAVRWAPGGGPAVFEAGESAPAAADPAPRSAPASALASAAAEVVVHVTGAVRRPGVYRLKQGARAQEAVQAAGGLLGDADESSLNLARVVTDGEQLVVPVKGQAPAASAAAAGAGGAAAAAGGKVDINRATAEQLDALPGVGPSTAAKIVQEREQNGPFKSPEDLGRVPGIGPKKLDALKDLVTAG